MVEKAKEFQLFNRDNTQRNKNLFYTVLITVALVGGGCAFFIPPFITSYGSGDSLPILRQTILAATGGVLAILTLWENRRKNDQEHIRQVHAERRSRYATAVEQLADEKAPIRLGGVYTLIKLVDEWLADKKTLPTEEERQEEGQIIVNSLCAYIRSSFDLASNSKELSESKPPKAYKGGTQQFIKDQARFREEKKLRITILSEIKKRLNGGSVIRENGFWERVKGSWSDFDYDFSNAVFFYPVNFSDSHFNASLHFTQATLIEKVNLSRTRCTKEVELFGVKFIRDAVFSEVNFIGKVDFSRAHFMGNANFSKARFMGNTAFFSRARFAGNAIFARARFAGNATFVRARFAGNATFVRARFARDAGFSKATFTGGVDFSKITYTNKADFSIVNFRPLF